MDWSLISQFFSDNVSTITFTGVLTAISGAGVLILSKKVIPAIAQKLLVWITAVVSKMFGVPQENVATTVQELPIVKQLQEAHKEFVETQELKLIELKNKLVSPKLTDAERLAYQSMFDQIIEYLGGKVSAGTQYILDQIELAAKQKLNM